MNVEHASELAARLLGGRRDAGGAPVLDHVQRVAAVVPEGARVVAWLHEVLEYTTVSEEALLDDGLSGEELRALRLLTRVGASPSDASYLAHVELITRAAGPGAELARTVKRADVADRMRNPAIRPSGWSPPYETAFKMLHGERADVPGFPSGPGRTIG
jgi:hypothetical protein